MSAQRLETAKKYVAYHTDLQPEVLEALISPTYHHSFAPSSISSSMPGPFDRAAFIQHHTWLRSLITGFKVTTRHVFDVPATNQVIFWLDTVALVRPEARDEGLPSEEWEVPGECIFILDVSTDGTTVERGVEFFDSVLAMQKSLAVFTRAAANIAKQAEAGKE
jgi:hypothetical protein